MINFANNLILDFEKDSDRRISAICRVITVLIIVVILLNILHVFKISTALYPTLFVSAVILLIPTLFYDILGLRIAISVICIGITGKFQRLITALVKKNNELYEEQQIMVCSLSELV